MSNVHFLAQVFSQPTFSAAEQTTILAAFSRVEFRRHDYLLNAGQTAGHYWFLEQGVVRSFVIDVAGNDISTNFYTAGDAVIDWPSLFLRKPARESMQALTPCVCWQVDYVHFQQLFHSIEAFREAGRRRLVTSYFALQQHRLSLIADPAKERYRQLLAERPQLVQHVPLKQLATYLGITATSLSRIRNELAHE
ncbi:putative transcriptional regulator, Crp/Fnr family [Fibrella aestuarina BUZ 2]|uniref:Putative transcriptional regulator, Crp/Fnr family n=1 Tax=Fibrella aestuarina BUZ 2 TaxID=1166018 RepID=I0K688_9BACT|nr:Crp/Fnr family transcriptional regulator [Fibrella aestuarina]CCG99641.1 putative transcriptional regulator, Crp/Fnr family [Fibrella aestuarina BUZ 2]